MIGFAISGEPGAYISLGWTREAVNRVRNGTTAPVRAWGTGLPASPGAMEWASAGGHTLTRFARPHPGNYKMAPGCKWATRSFLRIEILKRKRPDSRSYGGGFWIEFGFWTSKNVVVVDWCFPIGVWRLHGPAREPSVDFAHHRIDKGTCHRSMSGRGISFCLRSVTVDLVILFCDATFIIIIFFFLLFVLCLVVRSWSACWNFHFLAKCARLCGIIHIKAAINETNEGTTIYIKYIVTFTKPALKWRRAWYENSFRFVCWTPGFKPWEARHNMPISTTTSSNSYTVFQAKYIISMTLKWN